VEGIGGEFLDRVADVLPDAWNVYEAKVQNFGIMLTGLFKNSFRVHPTSLKAHVASQI